MQWHEKAAREFAGSKGEIRESKDSFEAQHPAQPGVLVAFHDLGEKGHKATIAFELKGSGARPNNASKCHLSSENIRFVFKGDISHLKQQLPLIIKVSDIYSKHAPKK